MGKYESLGQYLDLHSVNYVKDTYVRELSWIKIGGSIKYAIYPKSRDELVSLIGALREQGIFFRVFGNTSNCMFLNSEKYDVFVFLKKLRGINIDSSAGIVVAEGGVNLSMLSRKAVASGLKGFEGMVGIPATVGGAIFMNAGSFDCEIQDVLESVTYLDLDSLTIKTIAVEALGFSYRSSAFLRKQINGIILKGTFRCERENPEVLKLRMERAIAQRKEFQEKKTANLGSLFATKDIYGAIAKHHRGYSFVLCMYRRSCFRLKKHFGIDLSDNKVLNAITQLYFLKRFGKKVFSDKTLNCFVNDSNTDEDFFELVNWIRGLTNGELPLENEIVNSLEGNEIND
jgi:UDP-N-acetylmuramate dehydrogenase